jgi:hypothetical protein
MNAAIARAVLPAALAAVAAAIALTPGRTPLWTYSATPFSLAVFAVIAAAAYRGLRVRWYEALLFIALLTGSIADARLAPVFIIAALPMLIVPRSRAA